MCAVSYSSDGSTSTPCTPEESIWRSSRCRISRTLCADRGEGGEGGVDDRLAAAGCDSRGVDFVAALGVRGASWDVADQIVAVAGDESLREIGVFFYREGEVDEK